MTRAEQLETCRLTEHDRHLIGRAVDEYHRNARSASDRDTAERLAYHAIGCSRADLRTIELLDIGRIIDRSERSTLA